MLCYAMLRTPRRYYASVSFTDYNVGIILDGLEALALAQDTIGERGSESVQHVCVWVRECACVRRGGGGGGFFFFFFF